MKRELISFLNVLDKNESNAITQYYFNKLEKTTQNLIKNHVWNKQGKTSSLTDYFIKAKPTDPIIKLVVELTLNMIKTNA